MTCGRDDRRCSRTAGPSRPRTTTSATSGSCFAGGPTAGSYLSIRPRACGLGAVKPKAGERRLPFRDEEARLILEQARGLGGADRWIPWLLAFTGARVEEVAQALVADVRERDGITYLDINAESEGKSLKLLIPLTQAWAQVVVGPVEAGGGDGSAAGLVAGVRGAVPRRRGLRPLAVREALARRVPLPRLRARQGLGAGPRYAAGRVRPLPPADLGDRRDRAAPQPPAAQALVPGGVAGRDAPERDLRPAAGAPARARLLQDRLAAAPQAAPGDGRPGAGAARRPGRGR